MVESVELDWEIVKEKVEDWTIKLHTTEATDVILQMATDEIPGSEIPEGVTEKEFRLYMMIAMPYQSYCRQEMARQFYVCCKQHASELFSAVEADFIGMRPFLSVVAPLLLYMCRIDTETSVTGVEAITPETPRDRLQIIGKKFDEDREHFCDLLVQGLCALAGSEPASLMFVEFSRIIYKFNGYPPLPRTIHDAHKIPADVKGEIDYFDEILQNLLTVADSPSLLDAPAQTKVESDNDDDDDDLPETVVKVVCPGCDRGFEILRKECESGGSVSCLFCGEVVPVDL